MPAQSPIKFAAVGLNHGHIYDQTEVLLRAGAELACFYEPDDALAKEYTARYPSARRARSLEEVLDDGSIPLVISAAIPSERAPLGIDVMRHGKDFMSDKPGFTSLEQLEEARRVTAETGRIYAILFGERVDNRATVRAGELVQAGAIGQVVHTTGLGPHRIGNYQRPWWFYKKEKYGGILTDIASHQADQFLFFTGSTQAEVAASQVANYKHPEQPELEDFGDMLLRGDRGSGYVRVDWYTPDGLGVWGDGRLFILGTEGYIELRKFIDPAGRPGRDHLFLVDQKGTQYIDCSGVDLPYGRQLIYDVIHRTQTAMTQEHVFLASRLALEAEERAVRLGNLKDGQ